MERPVLRFSDGVATERHCVPGYASAGYAVNWPWIHELGRVRSHDGVVVLGSEGGFVARARRLQLAPAMTNRSQSTVSLIPVPRLISILCGALAALTAIDAGAKDA